MKLLVDRLGDSPRSESFEADAAWWETASARLPELGSADRRDFRFCVEAHRMGQDLYLGGVVEGQLELECGRCLNRYRLPLHESFRVVLEPAGDRSPAEPEAAAALARDGLCLGDDIETGWFRGRELELGPFLEEVVALAIPAHPVCREDCLGLCPQCGADRNLGECGCREARPESPFAALRALRRPSDQGES